MVRELIGYYESAANPGEIFIARKFNDGSGSMGKRRGRKLRDGDKTATVYPHVGLVRTA